ncbi:CoA-binding protein [Sulfurimonas aquatica]|uniref:CoA-binding protein n=1 Tax=Sulfurimonas aquatica TaxID=2672570 RepID=A0A975GD01_9BACT|nr:CoA-binding protein [Sulfurimonas aquatica]QSZ41843.1 CoA-binding protein [Sulfurimonas aquatica]
MECQFPTVNSNKEEIRKIFSSVKTIAVLGLSPDPQKPSHRVAKYLQEQGYTIIPVYPKEELILGQKVYRSLAEIPGDVDMVDIFRKPDALMAVAQAAIERGDVKVFWAQEGIVNNEAADKAKAAGMTVVQNHCTMVEHKHL